jgi:hypothetical protein
LFLVLLLYACKEVSKIEWKLDEDEEAMGETRMTSGIMRGHAWRHMSSIRMRTRISDQLTAIKRN